MLPSAIYQPSPTPQHLPPPKRPYSPTLYSIHHISIIHTRPSHRRCIHKPARHHPPGRRIPPPNRRRRLPLDPEITRRLPVLRIPLQHPKPQVSRIQHIGHLLPRREIHHRPLHRREPVAMGVRVPAAGERGQVALVRVREDGEEGVEERDGGAEGVVGERGRPEGRDEVRGVPAGRDAVLQHVCGGGVGGGEVARVAGEGGVADEGADAGGFGGVGGVGGGDAGVVGFEKAVEVGGLAVLGGGEGG